METDQRIALKIFDLIKDIQRDPFKGLGKPELLRGDFKGMWSRRINDKHRLVYAVNDEVVHIVRCRFHYDK